MASTLKFDSERREMRRERHEARVARKLERQQARVLKHSNQSDGVRVPVVATERPAPAPVAEVAPSAPVRAPSPRRRRSRSRLRLTAPPLRRASRWCPSASATSRRSSHDARR